MRAIFEGIVPRESHLAGLALARIMELARALTSLSPTPRGTPIFYFRSMSARPPYISVTKLNISIADKMLFYY